MTSSQLHSPAVGSPGAAPAGGAAHPTTVLDVLAVVPAEGVDPVDAVAVAGALQAGATHPVGVAIAAYAAEQVRFWPAMTDVDRIDDVGVVGDTGARVALLGSPALVEAHGIALPALLVGAVVDAAIDGRTPLVLAWNGEARAVLVVGERERPEPARPEPARPRQAPRRSATWAAVALLALLAAAAGLRRYR